MEKGAVPLSRRQARMQELVSDYVDQRGGISLKKKTAAEREPTFRVVVPRNIAGAVFADAARNADGSDLAKAGGDARLTQQVFDIAGQLGDNLVEVSFTMAPRESHAEWEGQVYQINGAGEYQNFYVACKYGDPVDGYGGYNCGHSVSIFRGYRSFKDPTAGTGYTKEEAYALTQRQRYLENEMRKDKRERDVLASIGYPTQDVSARLAYHKRQLDNLVAEHSQVLVNQTWRTRVYAAASEEQKRVLAGAL